MLFDPGTPDRDQVLANLFIDCPTSDFPPYVKLILDSLIDTRDQLKSLKDLCSKIVEENSSLRAENAHLRQLLLQATVPPPSSAPHSLSQSPTQPASQSIVPSLMFENEFERRRSIVLSGIPESSASSSIERASHDTKLVHSVLDFLNIECIPCSVYRMGRPDCNRSRLIKVLLPSSKFQEVAVRRAPRLRSFFHKGVYLRPSLTKEERERRRGERLAKKQALHPSNDTAPNLSLNANSNVHVVQASVSHPSPTSDAVTTSNLGASSTNASVSLSQPQGNV